MIDSLREQLDERGYAITSPVISPERIAALIDELGLADVSTERRGGLRPRLSEHAALRELATRSAMCEAAAGVLGPECFPVRALFFEKTPGANWKVAWHQDLTIAVRERRDVPGFGPWTEKDGVMHVQPPAGVLERMVTVRLHLDVCHADNGPVRVIPGSHRHGRLSSSAIAAWREREPEVVCGVDLGGLLVMRPLLLHASSPCLAPQRRRVVHIEYADAPLAGGLQWFERAAP